MSVKNAKEFGNLIRDTRKAINVTQKALAAASGTGVRFIQDLERGKPTCELEKALWVASMLGMKIEITLPKLTHR